MIHALVRIHTLRRRFRRADRSSRSPSGSPSSASPFLSAPSDPTCSDGLALVGMLPSAGDVDFASTSFSALVSTTGLGRGTYSKRINATPIRKVQLKTSCERLTFTETRSLLMGAGDSIGVDEDESARLSTAAPVELAETFGGSSGAFDKSSAETGTLLALL